VAGVALIADRVDGDGAAPTSPPASPGNLYGAAIRPSIARLSAGRIANTPPKAAAAPTSTCNQMARPRAPSTAATAAPAAAKSR